MRLLIGPPRTADRGAGGVSFYLRRCLREVRPPDTVCPAIAAPTLRAAPLPTVFLSSATEASTTCTFSYACGHVYLLASFCVLSIGLRLILLRPYGPPTSGDADVHDVPFRFLLPYVGLYGSSSTRLLVTEARRVRAETVVVAGYLGDLGGVFEVCGGQLVPF